MTNHIPGEDTSSALTSTAWDDLKNIPFAEPTKQMESFREAKQNGTLPEGVRDEQDYQEYNEQNKAKFNEAQAFLYEHFSPSEETGITPEAMDHFLKSEKFEAFTRSGVSLNTLLQQGIISDKMPNIPNTPYDDHKDRVFRDMTFIVEDIGFMQIAAENGFDELAEIKPIIEKWGTRPGFDEIDTGEIVLAQTMGPSLQRRLLFGNPYMDVDDKNVTTLSHVYKTLDYLAADIEPGHAMDGRDFEVLEQTYNLASQDQIAPLYHASDFTRRIDNDGILKEIGKVCRKQTEGIARLMIADGYYSKEEYPKVGKLILESASQNTVLEHYDVLREAGFTDEELLGSIYHLKSGENIKKLGERKDPDYYLARHFGRYERAGFEQKSIIKVLHKNKVYLSAEEIEDMRKVGVSNIDIAYAGRLYKNYWPERGVTPEKLEATGFSEKDILMAALRAARER